jgi:hypothetical protein
VGNLLDEAAARRHSCYSSAAPPKGYSSEQIEQFRQDHQRNWKQEQGAFTQKVSESFRVPGDIKKSFQEINERQKTIIDTLKSIQIPTPKMPDPVHTKLAEPVSDFKELSTHRLSQEGKEVRRG